MGRAAASGHDGNPRDGDARHVAGHRFAQERAQRFKSIVPSLGIVILGSLMIIVTSLVEIIVWAAFFLMMGALENHSSAFYYAGQLHDP